MRKIWDIHGGVHPPENKHQSVKEAIASIDLPDELIIPINQHIGAPADVIVEVGQTVLKGQVIAQAHGIFSAHVHASSSGTITAIEPRPIAHPSGLHALCVVIAPDGRDQWCELEPCEHYETLDHYELVARIQKAGLAGMGGAGFPTSVKLNPKSVDQVNTLILNGTECEPYITADDMLMREHAEGIIAGAKLLAKIVGKPKQILIGIEDNKPEAIARMQKAAESANIDGTAIEVVPFPTKYPSGGEKQLIQILTGKELPSGKLPAQIGVLVQNVGTAFAAWRAVRFGEPLIERVTTVVGEALGTQRNVYARIGTPIQHLLNSHQFQPKKAARVVIGGPMMGFAVTDLNVPVVKTTNCVLVPSHQEMPPAPPAQACIRCGMCAEACPANLLPQQLFWYAKSDDFDRLKSHNLFDCIECGACSFVCPSAIPLVQYYRSAKGAIRIQDLDKQKSDRARQRFDQRKERIAKAEAEKEAKRQARKKAAEEAKKKLAQKTASENTDKPAPAKPDLVAEAIARAKAQSTDPEAQLKKLNRALTSAQSRWERAQKQLAEATDENREKLAAAVKQAQQKVDEAEQKLNSFSTTDDSKSESASASGEKHPIEAKLTASPLEAKQKAVATLQKRVATAEQKIAEAETEGSATAAALAKGLETMRAKLAEAEAELNELQNSPSANEPVEAHPKVMDAAAAAIEKAKAKAAAAANQTDEEKRAAQIESLKTRISKAEQKFEKAKAENSEHVDTLATSLDKLKNKLSELET